jgi:hypothetical protein
MDDDKRKRRLSYPVRLNHPRFPGLAERLEKVVRTHGKKKGDVILEGTDIRVSQLEKKEPV